MRTGGSAVRWGGCAKTPADIKILRDLDFDFAEVILSTSSSRRHWWESGIKSEPHGFFLIAHGPITDPADDVRSLWDHYIPALKSTVDTAQRMGIELLTIHMDISTPVPTLPQSEELLASRELLRQEKLRAIAELVQYAQASGVTIALENVSESAADLSEATQVAPGLGIILDVGHGQLRAERNRSLEIIENLGQFIVHVHLHDNDGIDDLHLTPGKGIIDFKSIFAELLRQGYDGTVTFEVRYHDLAFSRKRGQELIGGSGAYVENQEPTQEGTRCRS